jgi:hypothetical protein
MEAVAKSWVVAKAGDEYSTMAPGEVRLLGRAKACGVVTDNNEAKVQAICAAIMRLEKTSLCAAIAEAIQYEQPGGKNFDEWLNTPIVLVPVMNKNLSNYHQVRDTEQSNAIVRRVVEISWKMLPN